MEKTNKLYKIILRGMTHNSIGTAYGISYVVAENSDEAYQKVKKFLDEKNLGYAKERELFQAELIAEAYQHSNTGTILYL